MTPTRLAHKMKVKNEKRRYLEANFMNIPVWLCTVFIIIICVSFTDMISNPSPESSYQIDIQHLQQNDSQNYITVYKKSPIFSTEKSQKKWTIIAFSNKAYIPPAETWYNQLTKIGYKNHKVVSMDDDTFDYFQNKNMRVINATFPPRKKKRMNKFRQYIFALRFATISQLLKSGQNVFISDVDSIWINYRNLNLLPFPDQIDAFHAVGQQWPIEHYNKYGFVMCGCIQAYRSNQNTIKLFDDLLIACDNKCDDQEILNRMYMDDYKFEWSKKIPGMGDIKFGRSTAIGKDLTAMLFDQRDVVRGHDGLKSYQVDFKKLCSEKRAWILSPEAKPTAKDKIDLLNKTKACFVE